MDIANTTIQITFHYVNGQSETYEVPYLPSLDTNAWNPQQEIQKLLGSPWCILHLPDQTLCILTANVVKLEIKPPMLQLQGEGIFFDTQRLTTFGRNR